jgi:hypothetical protein
MREPSALHAQAGLEAAHGYARITANEALIRRSNRGVHAKPLILNGEQAVELIPVPAARPAKIFVRCMIYVAMHKMSAILASTACRTDPTESDLTPASKQ